MAHNTISKRTKSISTIKPKTDDPDAATDDLLLRGQKTLSKGRIRRMKVMSAFAGNTQPTRRKIFSTVQLDIDCKLFDITVHNKTISCAKVFNPLLLEKNSSIWNSLVPIQRFELEDPEGILTTIPKHYAANMQHLESFSITWTRVKSLPNELFSEALRTLSLQRNLIKTLNGIERAVNLSNLDVSSNLLTELPDTIGQLQNLTTLNISGNAIIELPANFCSLTQLRMLNCSCNRLSALPNSICNLIELLSLDVGNNKLTELPDGLADLPKLTDLQAQVNQLEKLPSKFDRLINLSSLNLRKNRFTEVPPQLAGLSSLQKLNMKDNIIRKFQTAIPSLRNLILDSNFLEGISDGLVKCSNLQMASLENNKIVAIPSEISNLSRLRVLQLSRNDIDEVPEDIGNLQHLRHLNLRATQIETLPNAILTMPELVKLDVDECPRLQPYLRLAYKNGGLVQLREEMRQMNENNGISETIASDPESTDHKENIKIAIDSSETEERNSNEEIVKISNRSTVLWIGEDEDLIEVTEESTNPQTTQNETSDNSITAAVDENESEKSDVVLDNCNTRAKFTKVGPPTRPKTQCKPPDNSKLLNGHPAVELRVVGFDKTTQERQSIKIEDTLIIGKRQSRV